MRERRYAKLASTIEMVLLDVGVNVGVSPAELCGRARIRHRTFYSIVARLEQDGIVQSDWDRGKHPSFRLYRLGRVSEWMWRAS